MKPHISRIASSLKCVSNNIYLFKPSHLHPQRRGSATSSDVARTSINSFTERSHNCGQLSKKDVGRRVDLFGWVQHTRYDNKIITLRDSYGVTQCISDASLLSPAFRKTSIYNESVLRVSGTVRERPQGQMNQNTPTGEIEVLVDRLKILNLAKKDLSILTRDEDEYTSLNRLKYRYLDLRSRNMQHALRFRAKVCKIFRNKLYDLNFVECETPTLFNRTPGGANEFVVPTQDAGKFYSLVQSPQQLKQLLMIGGLDRYFQICRCYRDEPGRSDRQPEFTQLDIELSFTNQTHIMNLVDSLILKLLENISDESQLTDALTSSFDENLHIKRMTYQDALEMYGTEKPDTRFGWEIKKSEEGGLFLEIPHIIDREGMFKVINAAKQSTNLSKRGPDIVFEATQTGESGMLVKTSQRTDDARRLLGAIRVGYARELEEGGQKIYKSELEFLWVTDFPLFTIDDRGKLESNHHPFTAPTEDTVHFLEQNPLLMKGQHYDLVLNGQEVAGGSMRIHDAELQRRILTDILQVDDSSFGYFVDALDSGCPPHGGIAFGLDRLVAMLLNKKSIRDVIAFPKSKSGRDLMTNCPEELSVDIKCLYHLN